ncbi:thioredoxin family protein [Sediminitomix flava]|uniref:Uncharacterized protein DUF255 n=1 Tax=Sediminitomix flava TaxID=379075 RepID=A0A315ZFZ4_SEDFL|nr:DUF255 domain-containing protein [Sediminitomix flava]PWJ44505.1 uncharacterized protein DUF255 [Sediminitomix flava]
MTVFRSSILFTFLLSVINLSLSLGQEVEWQSFEKAMQENTSAQKMIFIDVYTDWCGYCKKMDKMTFKDPKVSSVLNEKFMPIKFNAEQKEPINFNGNEFKFVANGRRGYHELAAALLGGRLSYPTVVLASHDFDVLLPIAGFRQKEEMHMLLSFFSSHADQKDVFSSQETFDKKLTEFRETYKSPY